MERGYGQGSNTIKVRGHLGSAKEVNDQMCVIHLGFVLSEEAGCCEVKREKSNSSINEIGFDIDQHAFSARMDVISLVRPALRLRVVRISQ